MPSKNVLTFLRNKAVVFDATYSCYQCVEWMQTTVQYSDDLQEGNMTYFRTEECIEWLFMAENVEAYPKSQPIVSE